MTAQRSSDSEDAALMGPRAWGLHVVGALQDSDSNCRLLASPARRPFAGARRHALVDLEAREIRAEVALIAGFESLRGRGIRVSDGQNAANYVVSRVIVEGLARGFSSADLGRALHRLLERGIFMREVVGKHRNRTPRCELHLADEQQANGGHAPGAGQHVSADAMEARRRADRA